MAAACKRSALVEPLDPGHAVLVTLMNRYANPRVRLKFRRFTDLPVQRHFGLGSQVVGVLLAILAHHHQLIVGNTDHFAFVAVACEFSVLVERLDLGRVARVSLVIRNTNLRARS
jgi:hypothetical protein